MIACPFPLHSETGLFAGDCFGWGGLLAQVGSSWVPVVEGSQSWLNGRSWFGSALPYYKFYHLPGESPSLYPLLDGK